MITIFSLVLIMSLMELIDSLYRLHQIECVMFYRLLDVFTWA